MIVENLPRESIAFVESLFLNRDKKESRFLLQLIGTLSGGDWEILFYKMKEHLTGIFLNGFVTSN